MQNNEFTKQSINTRFKGIRGGDAVQRKDPTMLHLENQLLRDRIERNVQYLEGLHQKVVSGEIDHLQAFHEGYGYVALSYRQDQAVAKKLKENING